MSYEYLRHTADVKFKAEGNTIEEMFTESAAALFEIIRGNIKILEIAKKEIDISAKDKETLLHDFLEEFLFLLDSEEFLVSKIEVIKITKDENNNFRLKSTLAGDLQKNYSFTNDVKAITFNEMEIKEENGKFICTVVLDV